MIPMLLAAAMAATPEELAKAAPEAQQTLDRCAHQGCDPGDGARAAWVVALHRYVSEGLADGMLAATVQVIDPELFSKLPPVLRDAVTAPMIWATEPPRDPPETDPLPPLPAYAPHPKLPHGALFIEVVDGSGKPLPSARIRFPVEAEVHSVNSESGMWMSTVLYAYDGTERYFQKGMEVEFEAFAPGFGHRRVTFEPSKRKKNLVRVELEPWTLAASPDATEPELRAVAAWSRWLEAAEAHHSDPSVESARTLNHVRSLTATAARDWLDATGSADARQLCWMTGTAQLCGT